MANIGSFLQKIKSAIYGEEVRGSIYDALDAMNKESENALSKSTNAVSIAGEASLKVNQVINDTAQTLASAKSYSESASQFASSANNSKIAAESAKGSAENASSSAQGSANVASQKAQELASSVNSISALSTQIAQLQNDINSINQQLNNKVEYIGKSKITIDILKDVNYPNPYETSSYVQVGALGNLPPGWYHFKFFKHVDKNGYCMQEAFSLSVQGDKIQTQWRRNSDALVWNDWIQITDSYNGFQASRFKAQVKTRHIEGTCPGQDGTLYLNLLNRKSVVIPKPNTQNEYIDIGAEILAIKQRLGM